MHERVSVLKCPVSLALRCNAILTQLTCYALHLRQPHACIGLTGAGPKQLQGWVNSRLQLLPYAWENAEMGAGKLLVHTAGVSDHKMHDKTEFIFQ